MKRSNLIITILLFILGAICFIFFEVVKVQVLEDVIANKLLCGFIARAGLSLLFGWLLYQAGGRRFMVFDHNFLKCLLWAIPCFMVALVNFPIAALIKGEASVIRTDLIGLYLLYVISVAVLEEFIFRGTLLIVISDVFRNKRHGIILTALVCSLIFSLFHLTNLFEGMGIADVLLQCVYTFLIGGMLIVTMMKSKNIWLCILIHTIFDFGGLLIIYLGIGNPWDIVFWILTISVGVLCAGHIIYTLIKLDKDYVS